jgi:hypothetical protein
MAKKSYVVTAPYVTLQTGTREGVRLLGFYQGSAVPDDVPDEQIQHHLDNDLIAEQAAAEEILAGEVVGAAPAGSVTSAADPPAKSASKADWKAYAVSQGMAEDLAESTSRDDLAAQYLG